jgi:hypothetical protein
MWLNQIQTLLAPPSVVAPTSYRQREAAARQLAFAGATLDEITAQAGVSETMALRMLSWASQAR